MLDRAAKLPRSTPRRRERRRHGRGSTATEHERAQHAERQRRSRRRAKAGLVWVGTDFTPGEVDKLVRFAGLYLHEVEDPAAIAAALHRLIADIEA